MRARCALRAATAALAALLALTVDAQALTPGSTPIGDWTLVGNTRAVNATALSGQAIYLGGNFSAIARRANGVAAFEPVAGVVSGPRTAQDELATLDVSALEPAADGGMYVAGRVAEPGGSRLLLLRYTPAGERDPSFRPDIAPRAQIADMKLGANGSLYLAGDLVTVGGQPRASLAAVDASTGAVLAWTQSVEGGGVSQLELGPQTNTVYLAGTFTRVGGQPRSRLAAVSPGGGAVTNWDPKVSSEGGAFSTVNAIARAGSTVYLGGVFGRVGDQVRRNLAAVDAGSGAALPWSPQPNDAVDDVAVNPTVSGASVYVGGDFKRFDGPAPANRQNLAALHPVTGNVIAEWNPAPTDKPTALLADGDSVYVGFSPESLGLPTVGGAKRCGLAAVNAQTGVATSWDPRVSDHRFACDGVEGQSPARVVALARGGANVWAGGDFEVVNVQRRTNLAAIDATSGAPLPWAPKLGPDDGVSSVVRALTLSSDASRMYIGGKFTSLNGLPRLNAGAVLSTGSADASAAVTGWDPAPDSAPTAGAGLVTTLAASADGRRVYLGGDFRRIGPGPDSARRNRTRLAAVTADSGAAVADWAPAEPNGSVADLTLAGGRLYVAGTFTRLGTPTPQDRAGVAALVEGSGSVDPAWNARLLPTGATAATVDGLAVTASHVYVAGQFSLAGDEPANIAQLGLATGDATAWRPDVNGRVRRVTIDPTDGAAYVAGDFTQVGGAARRGAASVAADAAVTGWDPAPAGAAQANAAAQPGAIVVAGDRVALAGQFTSVGGVPQSGFGLFGPAAAPTALTPPTVEGAARIGSDLDCRPGTFGGGSGSRTTAWLRDGAEIAGATSARYRVVPEDQLAMLRCRETVSNAAGSVSQDSAPVSIPGEKPALDTPPAVTGEPWVGGTAQCTSGLWRNAPTRFEYQWLLDGSDIPGETTPTHRIAAMEENRRLACAVVAVNESGTASALSAERTVTEAPPSHVTNPLIAGEARVGVSLTCVPGSVERARSLSYQWFRDGALVVGAAAPTFIATSRDVARLLTCLVTATNAGGSAGAESAAVLVVAAARSSGTGRRPNPADDAAPAAAAASKRFAVDLLTVRVRSRSRLAVTVKLPAAGRLSVLAVTRPVRGRRAGVIARGTRVVRRAMTVTLTLRLGSKARGRLVRAGKGGLRTTVTASFRAAKGGATTRDRANPTLKAPRPEADTRRNARRTSRCFSRRSPVGHRRCPSVPLR